MNIKQEHHLDALNRKHHDLDTQIKALQESSSVDDIEMQKLKQEKLRVKDEIFSFKRQLANDILSGSHN